MKEKDEREGRIMKEHCNCPYCCCGDKDCSGKEFLEEEVAEQ